VNGLALIVCKFGGSSVATLAKMKNVAAKIQRLQQPDNQVVVVVSAMGDTTDNLLEMTAQINSTNNRRELDMLVATGEQQSAAFLALTLFAMGTPAFSVTSFQAGIYCDTSFGKARLVRIEPERIKKALAEGYVVVVAGFQGVTPEGDVATLGRGGSDTTAVALSAALGADICKIFTDVNGVYTADPRIVPRAQKLEKIAYEEMLEMASLGAGVMQPRAVECAMLNGVNFEVLCTFNDLPGTMITEADKMEKQRTVSGVAYDLNVAKIALFDVPDEPGVAMRVFKRLAEAKINVDMVIQSAMRDNKNDISFTIEKQELDRALPIVHEVVKEIKASDFSCGEYVAKVSIVGAGMQSDTGVAADMFEALADAGINIQMIATSEIKISCIINEIDVQKAVQVLHSKFGLDAPEVVE
jgi:aspartate kinase